MKIESYQFNGIKPNWIFPRIELGRLNLVVGDTASGKTRLLNTISNLGSIITGQRPLAGNSRWRLTFSHKGLLYGWDIRTTMSPSRRPIVVQEHLWKINGSSTETFVRRSQSTFLFKRRRLPKLSQDNLSITLLKEEDIIRPLYEAFSMILRRNFFSDALQNVQPTVIQPDEINKPVDNLLQLHNMDLPLSPKLFILRKNFPSLYRQVTSIFREIFPFVTAVDVKDFKEVTGVALPVPGLVPLFVIKERYINQWIGVHDISSGMQKVLLMLTDTLTLPQDSLYIVDEYENSLGVSTIDFFPPFLDSSEANIQFILTSHHPYLINKFSPENWIILHRRGTKISARYGLSNLERYGKSAQQRFIQLLNDPFYSEGRGE